MTRPEHPLCPVHAPGAAPAEVVWDGRCGALVGPAAAIGRCLQGMTGREDVEVSWSAAAFPDLPPEHPRQFLVMPVEVSGPAEPEFRDFHNGAFYIPRGSTIERSPDGYLCVFRAEPERHSYISTQPIALN